MSTNGRVSMSKFATHCEKTYNISYSDFISIVKQQLHCEIVTDKNHKYLVRDPEAPPAPPILSQLTATPATKELPLNEILENHIFQPRGTVIYQDGIDEDVVAQYTEWLEYSDPPALEVWQGCIDDQCGYWLLSGYHRKRALKESDRKTFPCVVFTEENCSIEEAIYRANTSNLRSKERQIFKMRSQECKRACKRFISVMNKLSSEAVREFIDMAQNMSGNKKTWSSLNNSVIGAVFGFSRTTIARLIKEIEFEEILKSAGIDQDEQYRQLTRIEFKNSAGDVYTGTIRYISLNNFNLTVDWDKARWQLPEIIDSTSPFIRDIQKTNVKRQTVEPHNAGDVWVAGYGVGILIRDENAKLEPNIWGLENILEPDWVDWVILFLDKNTRGMHRSLASFSRHEVDIEETTSYMYYPEERIEMLQSSQDNLAAQQIRYLRKTMNQPLDHLVDTYFPVNESDDNLPEPDNTDDVTEEELSPPNINQEPLSLDPSIPPNQTTTDEEVEDDEDFYQNTEDEFTETRKRLLGHVKSRGENGAELPSIPPNPDAPPEEFLPSKEEVRKKSVKQAVHEIEISSTFVENSELQRLLIIVKKEIARRNLDWL